MYKKCSSCKTEKLSSEFRKDKQRNDGLQSYCKVCARAYHKAKYTTNYGDQAKIRSRNRSAITATKLTQYKLENPCRCGESEPVCLEFHHRDPTQKDFELGSARQRKWESIVAEIEKCIVLCSNCHKKVHAGLIVL